MRANKNDPFLKLRKQAERMLKSRKGVETGLALAEAIHELEVYQVNLEVQNQEIKRIQHELEEARNDYGDLFEYAPIGYLIIGPKGVIVRTNFRAQEILGLPAEKAHGLAFSHLIHSEDLTRYSFFLRSIARYGKGTVELRLRNIPAPIWVRLVAGGRLHEAGKFPAAHLAISDITAQKEAETILKRSRDELELQVQVRTAKLEKEVAKRAKFASVLRESGKKIVCHYVERKRLAKDLVKLLERDRRDVAMALHDQVGSILTGAKMEIEGLESELAGSAAADRIARVKQAVSEVMNMIRNISSQLRPAALERFGLLQSVSLLIGEVERQSGLRIRFHAKITAASIPLEKELALYRVIQESLTNVIKHARAREVFITLANRNDAIHLSIEDDGKGFFQDKLDKGSLSNGHLGISIMKERMSQFNGTLTVESDLGRGTLVSAELPL